MDFLSLTNLLKIVHLLAAVTGYICWVGILWFLVYFVGALRRELKKKKSQESGAFTSLLRLYRRRGENTNN